MFKKVSRVYQLLYLFEPLGDVTIKHFEIQCLRLRCYQSLTCQAIPVAKDARSSRDRIATPFVKDNCFLCCWNRTKKVQKRKVSYWKGVEHSQKIANNSMEIGSPGASSVNGVNALMFCEQTSQNRGCTVVSATGGCFWRSCSELWGWATSWAMMSFSSSVHGLEIMISFPETLFHVIVCSSQPTTCIM